MLSSKTVSLFFAIVCCIQLQHGGATVQSSSFLFTGQRDFDNGRLVYKICKKITPDRIECSLSQRIFPEQEVTRSCNVTLKGEHEKSKLTARIAIQTFGTDKALLYWGDDSENFSFVKIGIVNFETCKINEVKIEDPRSDILMQFYFSKKVKTYEDNSFDVFVDDTKKFGKKSGKIHVNADGTKDEPVTSNIRDGYIRQLWTVANYSPIKGYVALRKDDENDVFLLYKPDGSEQELGKYSKSVHPSYTAGENFVTTCIKTDADSDVTCKQYDDQGNVKFTTTLAEAHKNVQPKAVHNLPGGGAVVLLAESRDSSRNNDIKYHMVYIDADGKVLGTAPIDEFDSAAGKDKDKYIYKHGDIYCGAIILWVTASDEKKTLDREILYHCVTKDEFKA